MHKPKHFIRTTHARTDSNACFFGHRDILRFCRFATALTATSIGETATTDPKNGSNVLGQSVQVPHSTDAANGRCAGASHHQQWSDHLPDRSLSCSSVVQRF